MLLSGPPRGVAFVTSISLPSRSDPSIAQVNPTLASGDFEVIKDDVSDGTLTTTPTVTPASGVRVKISLSADEMDADIVTVHCSDAAGAEWSDVTLTIHTSPLPGGVVEGTPSATIIDTDLSETTDDHYVNAFMFFLDGNLAGKSRKITSYDGTTNVGECTVDTFGEAPSAGDKFVILGYDPS